MVNDYSKISEFLRNGDVLLPNEYIESLDLFISITSNLNKTTQSWSVEERMNSRWDVMLAFTYRGTDGTEQYQTHRWIKTKKKPATKEQRYFVIQLLNEIGLLGKIKQETLGKMLSVATSTVNKQVKSLCSDLT